MTADRIRPPRKGWRLAWRQTYPDHSDLFHRHSTTIFPVGDEERLKTLCASVNAAYRHQDGFQSIYQWVEWIDRAEAVCTGSKTWRPEA